MFSRHLTQNSDKAHIFAATRRVESLLLQNDGLDDFNPRWRLGLLLVCTKGLLKWI